MKFGCKVVEIKANQSGEIYYLERPPLVALHANTTTNLSIGKHSNKNL
jgi:hypothetical protein